MSPGLIIPALFIAAVAIVIIGYAAKWLATPLLGNPLAWWERASLNRKKRMVSTAQESADPGAAARVLALYRSAFHLSPIYHDPSLIERSTNFNLDLLTRVVALSKRGASPLSTLPVVENLLTTRAELLLSYREVNDTIAKLTRRSRSEAGAATPTWALTEFVKKRADLRKRVGENRRALHAQLSELFRALDRVSTSPEITYH